MIYVRPLGRTDNVALKRWALSRWNSFHRSSLFSFSQLYRLLRLSGCVSLEPFTESYPPCLIRILMIKLITLLGALLLVGCATPYQQMGSEGGFQSQRLSSNTFAVQFLGNGFTSQKQADGFAFLRG
jgi:hypothetical protein